MTIPTRNQGVYDHKLRNSESTTKYSSAHSQALCPNSYADFTRVGFMHLHSPRICDKPSRSERRTTTTQPCPLPYQPIPANAFGNIIATNILTLINLQRDWTAINNEREHESSCNFLHDNDRHPRLKHTFCCKLCT